MSTKKTSELLNAAAFASSADRCRKKRAEKIIVTSRRKVYSGDGFVPFPPFPIGGCNGSHQVPVSSLLRGVAALPNASARCSDSLPEMPKHFHGEGRGPASRCWCRHGPPSGGTGTIFATNASPRGGPVVAADAGAACGWLGGSHGSCSRNAATQPAQSAATGRRLR